ncbi:MAG: hypothetical protein JKY32_07220 [Rhizobiales bacterium]|nr:hypothetical protein [Hyphomicrobiales bacterium]
MATYYVSFKITGSGNAEIEAGSQEEAEKKMNDGDFSSDPEVTDWDIETDAYRGGYIELSL